MRGVFERVWVTRVLWVVAGGWVLAAVGVVVCRAVAPRDWWCPLGWCLRVVCLPLAVVVVLQVA